MFEQIIGNEKIQELLKNAIKNNKASHSYLFIGTEGIGKKLIAQEFSKALLCLGENKYCNTCKSCIEFDSQNNPDFNIIEPDGNSIKIEQIREIQRKVAEKPIISSKKIYIINDSDKMTTEAQNCLLKTLEEPPEYITIILIGTNENSFLSTIKSRCTIIHFQDIPEDKIQKYLSEKEGIHIQDSYILKAFGGSIGKAIQLQDKQEQYTQIQQILVNLKNMDIIEIFQKSQILYDSKEEITNLLQYINTILLELAKQDYKYTNCIQIVENTKKRLQSNANYDMSIDNMLLQMKEEIN